MYSHASEDDGQDLSYVQRHDGDGDCVQNPAEAGEANVVEQAVVGEHDGQPDQARRRTPRGFCDHEEFSAGCKNWSV
jgi:hypothetical protein